MPLLWKAVQKARLDKDREYASLAEQERLRAKETVRLAEQGLERKLESRKKELDEAIATASTTAEAAWAKRLRDAEAEHEQELHSLRQKNALQRGGDEKRAARYARVKARSEVEAELAQARADAAAALRERRGSARRAARRPQLCRNATPSASALRAATEGHRAAAAKIASERDAALAASNAGSEGIATAVETALREERLKHNDEINALQQDHAVEFAKANRSHGNAIDAISREYGAKIEALKNDQQKTKAATEGLEKQVSDGVARFAKEHSALTDALAAAREEHAASVVALRKQHAPPYRRSRRSTLLLAL